MRTPDGIFQAGLKEFEDKNYLEAQKLFEIIKLQYPASQYADDSQYYLAEIEFKKEKYIMASFNYNLLRRLYPGSEYSQLSLFKSALSLYKQTPKFDRDQDYTKKALTAFQEFQNLYPKDSLFNEANKLIEDLRNKLAEREFSVAELYKKLEYFKSSLVYYDSVINDYEDTKFFEQAYIGKISVLIKIKKYEEALSLIDLYTKSFPQSNYKTDISELKSKATLKIK
jgi:outer membrane protein assembly factor BamD